MLSSKQPLSVFVGLAGNNLLKKTTAAGITSILFNRRSISTTKMVQIKVSRSFGYLPIKQKTTENKRFEIAERQSDRTNQKIQNVHTSHIWNFPDFSPLKHAFFFA